MNNESFGKWICKWWYMVRRTSTKLFARTFASPGRFSWAAACSSTGRIAGYQAGLDRFLWHVPNSHVLHVEDCFVRFFRQRNDVPVPRHESHLNEGRAPRIRKISESLHQKSQYIVGKAVAAGNVASIAKLPYILLPLSKLDCDTVIAFLWGGRLYGEYSMFN